MWGDWCIESQNLNESDQLSIRSSISDLNCECYYTHGVSFLGVDGFPEKALFRAELCEHEKSFSGNPSTPKNEMPWVYNLCGCSVQGDFLNLIYNETILP